MKREFDKKQKKRKLTRLERTGIIIGIIVGVIGILSYVSGTSNPIELYNFLVSIIQEPEPPEPPLKLINNPIVIIDSQEVLGGTSNMIWLEAHEGNYKLPSDFTFNICSFDGKIRTGSGSFYKKSDNTSQSIEIVANATLPENATRKVEWDFAKVIGICGDWNPFPRKPYVTDGGYVARDAYIMEIASHFEDTKLKNCTIVIDEIIRVDLEGDSKVDKSLMSGRKLL